MSQTYTLCEVKLNNGKNGKPVWIVVKGAVYDVTKFLQEHPGGEDTILEYAGKDATKAFNQVGHSTDAIRDMKLYKIGVVAEECMTHLKSDTKTKTTTTTPPSVIITPPQPTDNSTSVEQTQTIIEPPKQCCGKPEDKPVKLFCCC